MALLAYLSDDYNFCVNQIKQINHFIDNQDLKERVLYLNILSLNELTKWAEAKVELEKYLAINEISLDTDSLYYFIEKPRLRSAEKAKKLSYWAPGLGQIYAGYVGKGLLSSSIQLLLIGFSAYSLFEGYFFTGALTGVGLLYSFYFGGARHAGYLADEKNKNLIEKYNQRIRNVVLEIEKRKASKI